jgi:uncharacterized membrane protein YkoI
VQIHDPLECTGVHGHDIGLGALERPKDAWAPLHYHPDTKHVNTGRTVFRWLIPLLALWSGPLIAYDFSRSAFSDSQIRSLRAPGRGGMPLDRAVSAAKRSTGGRVLSAQTSEQRGRLVHRIKVLTPEGQVRYIDVDADSGEVRR